MKCSRLVALALVAVLTLCWRIDVQAQVSGSTITGVVRDTSAGVLPGVTVEAASPALIGGARSAITDRNGLYRLVDLRPGDYTVTFTLPGFTTFRREGISLPANFIATVNAEMTVGGLAEDITVTADAPLIDTQSSRQQLQVGRETLDSLPGTGRLTGLSQFIPGVTLGAATDFSVGGVNDTGQTRVSIHGTPEAQPVLDGVNQQIGGQNLGVFVYNPLTFEEVVVEVGGVSADRETGGMLFNVVQRDGGNTFSGGGYFSYSGSSLESDNIGSELIARNLVPGSGGLKRYYDAGLALGGPIRHDRIWFFGSFRQGNDQQNQQGNYYNARQGTLFYEPDLSRPAITDRYNSDYTVRLTSQIAGKHRLVVSASAQPACNCAFSLLSPAGNVLTAPEATGEHHYNPQFHSNAAWRYPVTSRLLLETTLGYQMSHHHTKRLPTTGLDVQITDVGLNYRYGSRALNLGTTGSYILIPRWQAQPQLTMSYVTSAHVVRAGMLVRYFSGGDVSRNTDPNQINQGMSYTFRNRVPTNVQIWAVPYAWEHVGRDYSFFAQDQWTLGRTTLNFGVRYNDVSSTLPEVRLAPGPFVPERILPEVKNEPHWRNLNPRLGIAHDLGGTGRTAVKAYLGRYNPLIRTTSGAPAEAQVVPSTNRTWNDANGNFIPDCDLLNPNLNGECGPWSVRTFGQNVTATPNAPDARSGFNRQSYHWEASAAIEHELRRDMRVNLGYFRTWYGGFLTEHNRAVASSDYTEYCFTVPTDPLLPTSGQQLCGLYDINPNRFGFDDRVVTQQSNFGQHSQVYNGVDVNVTARVSPIGRTSGGSEKVVLAGGVSIGRMVDNNCVIVNSPQDARPGYCDAAPPWRAGTQAKMMMIYPLPWDLQTSLIYLNIPGVENTPTYTLTNAQIAPSLGRNLAQCGTAAICNATVTVPLAPPGSMYEPRLQMLDVRFSRQFTVVGGSRLRANLDIANVFNASNVLSLQRQWGPRYLDASQVMGGRLIKIGAQFDF